MIKTVLKIEGMMCAMCENHINDAIRNNFTIKKVSSSYTNKETVIVSDGYLDKDALKKSLESMGYKILSYSEDISSENKFHLFKKRN